jgi:hypothetical protein
MRPLKAKIFGNFSHPSNQKKPMPHIQTFFWKNKMAKSCQKLPNYEEENKLNNRF